jgi:dTDP-4-dehydrorhamnose reductase
MKTLLIGASGTIGMAIAEELGSTHDVIRIGHQSGDYRVDITDHDSVSQLP